MSAKVVAVYSMKGGVGKTTLAVNLGWAAAALSARRTLLWDLDGQGAASWILRHEVKSSGAALAMIRREVEPPTLIRATATERLDLLPADPSLHELDVTLRALDARKRLSKVADVLAGQYDRLIIDCPPGLTATSEQVMRAADLLVVPVVPAPLAERALDAVAAQLARMRAGAALLPVFSMVDTRRALHKEALSRHPDWPVIPMASAFEQTSNRRAPVGAFAPRTSGAVKFIAGLWQQVERNLGR